MSTPPAITIDLAALPGESVHDHLLRIGDEVRRPKPIARSITPVGLSVAVPTADDAKAAEAQGREAMKRLRPKGKKR